MEEPNLDSIYETYIHIPAGINDWKKYINFLKSAVVPVIDELKENKIIDWYAFHVHDGKSGNIPISESDHSLYVHIRFELVSKNCPKKLIKKLTPACKFLRKVKDMSKIDGIELDTIKDNKIETAWKIIGETSELSLDIVKNDEVMQFSFNNILKLVKESQIGNSIESITHPDINSSDKLTLLCQFLHYIDNSLQLSKIGDSLEKRLINAIN